jgi:hypothetical protein
LEMKWSWRVSIARSEGKEKSPYFCIWFSLSSHKYRRLPSVEGSSRDTHNSNMPQLVQLHRSVLLRVLMICSITDCYAEDFLGPTRKAQAAFQTISPTCMAAS